MPKPSLNIVMADDDAEDLELMEYALRMRRPEAAIHKVSNGHQLLVYLKNWQDIDPPCLIILDYNMPELTGAEILDILKKENLYNTVPKVILSTSSTNAYIHECIKNGATEYFVKPNNMKDMELLAQKMIQMCNNE